MKNKNSLTEFGKEFRKIRIDNDQSIQEAAKKLRVSFSYLSAVERGIKNFPLEWYKQICELYKLDLDGKRRLANAITQCHSGGQLDIFYVRQAMENMFKNIGQKNEVSQDELDRIFQLIFNDESFSKKEDKL